MNQNVFFLLVLFVGIALVAPYSAAHARTGLFGSTEYASANLTLFTKWTSVLNKLPEDNASDNAACNRKEASCYLASWRRFIGSLKGQSVLSQVKEVQRFVNQSPYIIDPINWGVPDYWETPRQFFMRNGDCEDYAIVKFLSLRQLGIPNKDMRIVVLNDENLNILHAVLTVKIGSKTYVLDNQIPQIVSMDEIHHYRPIYSLNETKWWRHSF